MAINANTAAIQTPIKIHWFWLSLGMSSSVVRDARRLRDNLRAIDGRIGFCYQPGHIARPMGLVAERITVELVVHSQPHAVAVEIGHVFKTIHDIVGVVKIMDIFEAER